tara:strand:- start:3498 stop:5258 length:1761 start_codon:yes stop_codon:yes gene_type:complete
MSKSFWRAESTIPIVQTSSAITALNGLSFTGGQEVRIKVPPTTKFFQPRECYVQADIKLKGGEAAGERTKLQLDPELGGQILIRDIRIYSDASTGSVLLEEIQGYNSMVSVMRDFDTNDSEKKKRALTEGATLWYPNTRGTQGSTRSGCADILTNPYFAEDPLTTDNKRTSFTNDSFNTAKLCLPLETGIFRSDRVFPNLLTGLEIVITLEQAGRCITQLDSVMRGRRLALNPVFLSRNGSTAGAAADIANGDPIPSLHLTKDNSQTAPVNCPFCVGERVALVKKDNSSVLTTDKDLIITQINTNASGVEIVFDQTGSVAVSNDGTTFTANSGDYLVSMAATDRVGAVNTAYKPSFTLSNVELVVQEVDMGSGFENDMLGAMKEKGVIVQDILSCQNYRYSQQAGEVAANIRLPMNNARAKSIISQPTDSTVYSDSARVSCTGTYDIATDTTEDRTLNEQCAGLRGISDEITNFQFLYDGRLQPSRPVRCSKTSSKTSIDAQPLIETTKALVQAEISAKSLAAFNSNWLVSRALALNKGVYDTRNKDFNLQVNYEGTAPSKNKLWNNYCFHLRRINIRGDSISVEY